MDSKQNLETLANSGKSRIMLEHLKKETLSIVGFVAPILIGSYKGYCDSQGVSCEISNGIIAAPIILMAPFGIKKGYEYINEYNQRNSEKCRVTPLQGDLMGAISTSAFVASCTLFGYAIGYAFDRLTRGN